MSTGWKRPLWLALACVAAFFVVLVLAYWLPVARWADGWAVEGFLHLQRPWLSHIGSHVAHLANPLPFALWTLAVTAVALYRRRPRQALAVFMFLLSANVTAQALKVLLEHDRYHAFLGHAQLAAASFPSGHATASMSLAYAAVIVAPVAWRPFVAVCGALFALTVSESIMLLAWHFPSDVLGGFLLATAFALGTVAALRAAEQRWPERSGRAAAKRAIRGVNTGRLGALAAGFVGARLGALAAGFVGIVLVVGIGAAGQRTLAFADQHTTAVAAAVVVAALAAVLPLTVATLGARRS